MHLIIALLSESNGYFLFDNFILGSSKYFSTLQQTTH